MGFWCAQVLASQCQSLEVMASFGTSAEETPACEQEMMDYMCDEFPTYIKGLMDKVGSSRYPCLVFSFIGVYSHVCLRG